jgi:hypothetical protein
LAFARFTVSGVETGEIDGSVAFGFLAFPGGEEAVAKGADC